MALMSIRVKGTPINLIDNVRESNNSCTSLIKFDISSVENAAISISTVPLGDHGYDDIKTFMSGTQVAGSSFVLDETGMATVEIVIGNVDKTDAECNGVEVTVTDSTNDKTETNTFSRCRVSYRC